MRFPGWKRFAVLFLICFLTVPGFTENPDIVHAADSQKKVRVGYFENEIFQEGAEDGAVRKGYAYEYYLKLSEYTGFFLLNIRVWEMP